MKASSSMEKRLITIFLFPLLVMIDRDSPQGMRNYIWESFDYPTDTWIPGVKYVEKYLTSWRSSDDPSPGEYVMRIENRALPQMVIHKGKIKTFRTGEFCRIDKAVICECLRNCSCTAYANPYITNGGYGCLMWFGDLIDVKEHASELDSGSSLHLLEKETEKKTSTKLVLISIVSGVLVSGFINGLLLLMARQKGRGKRDERELEVPLFKLDTIAAATNNFSEDNIIGKGGFGPVYKGKLSTEEEIAVKRLSSSFSQGIEEFKNEVILIAKLQHRNLVRLLGCCIDGEEKILINGQFIPCS